MSADTERLRGMLAEALAVLLATHCDHCHRPQASEADWEDAEEGERPDLCWEDPGNCRIGSDATPAEFFADALLPVVAREIAAARGEALREAADEAEERGDIGKEGCDEAWTWLRIRAAQVAPGVGGEG